MSVLSILAATSLVGSVLARPGSEVMHKRDPSATANAPAATYSVNNYDGIGAGSNSYTQYYGDGSPNDGWPTMDQWVSFDDMFNNNKPAMFSSCSQYGVPNNSGPEVGAIYNGIQQIAAASNVDHRYILAEILQESSGCVRVPTTKAPQGDIYNPGLMQDFDGYYTCNCEQNDEYNEGCGVVNPCPQNTITQMIREGTQGTNAGDGLASLINQAQDAGSSGAQTFYWASWYYNQGSGVSTDNLGTYASDIANYLTGWTGGS